MSSNLVPMALDFLIAMSTAMIVTQMFCTNWTQVIKKWRDFSIKKIPVGLDFLMAKGTAMVAVEIFTISCKTTKVMKLSSCHNNSCSFYS